MSARQKSDGNAIIQEHLQPFLLADTRREPSFKFAYPHFSLFGNLKNMRHSHSFLFPLKQKINQSVVSAATIRRTIGATTSTDGNAHAQAITKACIHLKKKPLTGPRFTNVKMPDMMHAISIDIKNAKRSEAKRGGINILCRSRREEK